DTGLSRRTVQAAIRELPPDLIQARRGKDQRWVFTLLRPIAETPEAEAILTEPSPVGAADAPLDPTGGAADAPYPLKKDYPPEEKEEREAPADARAHTQSPSRVGKLRGGKEARRTEAEPVRKPGAVRRQHGRGWTALPPDDWQPDPEYVQM